jgi:hypothetical protein
MAFKTASDNEETVNVHDDQVSSRFLFFSVSFSGIANIQFLQVDHRAGDIADITMENHAADIHGDVSCTSPPARVTSRVNPSAG